MGKRASITGDINGTDLTRMLGIGRTALNRRIKATVGTGQTPITFALGAVMTFGLLVFSGLLDVSTVTGSASETSAGQDDSRRQRLRSRQQASRQKPVKSARQAAKQQPDPMAELKRINEINERNRRLMEGRHRSSQPPYGPQQPGYRPPQPGQPRR